MTNKTVKCPVCHGSGKERVFHNTGPDSRNHFSSIEMCSVCNGSGYAPIAEAERINKQNQFWDALLNKAK